MGPRPPAADTAHTNSATANATSMGALQVSMSFMVSMPRRTMHTCRKSQGPTSKHSGTTQGGSNTPQLQQATLNKKAKGVCI